MTHGNPTLFRSLLYVGAAAGALLAPAALAQTDADTQTRENSAQGGAAAALQDDIVVTATKRPEAALDVPVAVTAFDDRQLEAVNFRTIGSLSATMPNVALDQGGTAAGYQNFSIRGLGINSSIPSIDPTVGVFVDGVYQGINSGLVLDNFDLEAIEILRGPQGVLFGRNVTGGAVLVRTRKPGNDLEFRGRIGVETDPKVTADASISGALIDDVLQAKLAAYYSYDRGNIRDVSGERFGRFRQFIVRPMLRFAPSQNVEFLLRFEHGEANGQGTDGQNRALFPRDSHRVSLDEPGYTDNHWNSATLETNIDVAFGDGTITNIFGWREFTGDNLSDVDGTKAVQLHVFQYTQQEQYSNELRYAGSFGPVDVTLGGFYFTQDLLYIEQRYLAGGAVTRVGGGEGTFKTLGAFGSIDLNLTSTFALNAGVRFSRETKRASVGTLRAGGGDFLARTFVPDFQGRERWSDVSPKLGFQWKPSRDTNLYGFWAKGFRSGGFNFRNTLAGASPGPFDAEAQSSFELGFKQRFGGLGRITLAVFQNDIDKIQREVQVPIPAVGIAQLIQNVGDARIRGFEAEAQISPVDNLSIGANVGYADGKYRTIRVDLTGDGVINDADYRLDLPRNPKWTYGANITYDLHVGDLTVSSRVAYSRRDISYYLDNNLGILDPVDRIDANITFTSANSPVSFSIYGNNLTNEVINSTEALLPDTAAFGGDGAGGPRPLPTYSVLDKGRVIGAEIRLRF